jgi:hypothetical protein
LYREAVAALFGVGLPAPGRLAGAQAETVGR